MCRLRNIAMRTTKKAWLWDRRTDERTDRRRTKWSLCAAMLCRWHKNWLGQNQASQVHCLAIMSSKTADVIFDVSICYVHPSCLIINWSLTTIVWYQNKSYELYHLICGIILENLGLKNVNLCPQVSMVLKWRLLTLEEKIMTLRLPEKAYHCKKWIKITG